MIYFDIGLPSTATSSEWSLSLPTQCMHLFTSSYVPPCAVHLIPLQLITRMIFDD